MFINFIDSIVTLQFQIIGGWGVVIKEGGPTDNLNINKRGVQIKVGKELLTVEKYQYNFSYSVHLYIRQCSSVALPLAFPMLGIFSFQEK